MLHWINTKMLPSLFEITFKVVLEIIKSCSTTLKLKMIRNYQNNFGKVKSAMEYQKLHGNIIRIYHPSKHSSWWRRLNDVFKTSFVFVFRRRLQDVLIKANIFVLVIRIQDIFKTFSRHRQDVLPRRLQNVFKTYWKNFLKTSSRRLQDVFKTFSRRLQDILARRIQNVLRRLQDIFHKRLQDIFKTSCKDVFNALSGRIIKLYCSC